VGLTFLAIYTCILQQAEALVWLKARAIVMYALSAVFALCIGTKLAIDFYQASAFL
jgi:hypothetical protein